MRGMEFELDHLLNPAAVFDHPRDVLNDPDLTKQEKRAILSSWASDACAVESMPGLRQVPGGKTLVRWVESGQLLNHMPTPARMSREINPNIATIKAPTAIDTP